MKVEIKEGKVILDACELFDHMDPDELNKLVQSLSCQDAIVKNVADQLLEGWTEDGYHGGKCGDGDIHHTPIDAARRRIALGAGKVAQETIEAQQRTIEQEQKANKEAWARIRVLEGRHHD